MIKPEQTAEAVVTAVEDMVSVDHTEEADSVILCIDPVSNLAKLKAERVVCVADAVSLTVSVHSRGTRAGSTPQRTPTAGDS